MRGSGRAGYRQLELTGRWQMPDGQQLFFSYVRSRAQGDLNEFNNYLGNFPLPGGAGEPVQRICRPICRTAS
jgi:hypothetical protein